MAKRGSVRNKYSQYISDNFSKFRSTLNPDIILPELVDGRVITIAEKAKIEQLHGAETQSDKLLELLDQKGESVLGNFFDILKRHKKFEDINPDEAVVKRPRTDDIDDNNERILTYYAVPDVDELKHDILNKCKKLNKIKIFPDENVDIDLNRKESIMTLEFSLNDTEPRRYEAISIEEGKPNSSLPAAWDYCFRDNTNRVIKVLGQPGSGKTFALKQLHWLWTQHDILQINCKIMIFLSMKHVTRKYKTIGDIIRSTYIRPNLEGCADNVLRFLEQNDGNGVTFLIDGFDELDIHEKDVLFQVINGNLYPKARVIVSSRIGEESFKLLDKIKPNIKINIHGVNKHSFKDFLMCSGVSEETISKFLKKFKLLESELLKVPLYVTIILFILKNNFEIDNIKNNINTETTLFNYFWIILIRKWYERVMKRKNIDVVEDIVFDRSPIEESSNVPNDIQHRLIALGRMSLHLCDNNSYTFKRHVYKRYKLDDFDIQDCGIICTPGPVNDPDSTGSCIHPDTNHWQYFFIHKAFQENLAAMYAAFDFESIERPFKQECVKIFIKEYKNKHLILSFVFGFNPKLGLQILKDVQEYKFMSFVTRHEIGLEDEKQTFINVNLLAQLFVESNDKTVQTFIWKYIKVIDPQNINIISYVDELKWNEMKYIWQITELFNKQLDQESCGQLIKKWYDLDFEDNTCVQIPLLDVTLLGLLNRVQFCNISEIELLKSCTLDVRLMNILFPKLQTVQILDGFERDGVILHKVNGSESEYTVSCVSLNSESPHCKLSTVSCKSLINCKCLKTLNISRVNIFENNVWENQNSPKWGNLEKLEIYQFNLTNYSHHLRIILANAMNLTELKLFHFNQSKIGNMGKISVCKELFNEISHLKKLASLKLINISDKEGMAYLIDKVIPHMHSLSTLGLGDLPEIEGALDVLNKPKISLNRIKTFIIICYSVSGPTEETMRKFKKSMPMLEISIEKQ